MYWLFCPFFPDFFLLQTDARKVCLHIFEMYRLFLNNLRLKLGQNNNVVEVSFRHYSSVYISAVDSISTTNQCSKYHKIRQPMLIIFSTWDAVAFLWKGQNLTLVYTPNHYVVSKPTLVCTAVYYTLWMVHTDKFRPFSKKTSYCNINVDRQQNDFSFLGCG